MSKAKLQILTSQLDKALAAGKYSNCLDLLDVITNNYPELIEYSKVFSHTLISLGRWDAAQAVINKAKKHHPNSNELLHLEDKISMAKDRQQKMSFSAKNLSRFKNIHKNDRCIIIGNGPSLNKMDLSFLSDEYCFGMNRIYMGFDQFGFYPTYYTCVNPLVIEQSANDISKITCPKFISNKGIDWLPMREDIIFINTSNYRQRFSEDPINLGICEGYTVTYFTLQLAFYMGFKTVILIGVDHSFSTKGDPNKEVISTGQDANHFHPDYFGKGIKWHLPDLDNSEKHYRLADAYFKADSRKIIDATVGGKCPVFEKADYREIFHSPVK
jgi:hypothetical protein